MIDLVGVGCWRWWLRWLLLFDFFETETVRVGVEIKEINKRFTIIIITKELSPPDSRGSRAGPILTLLVYSLEKFLVASIVVRMAPFSFRRALNFFKQSTVSCLCTTDATRSRCCSGHTNKKGPLLLSMPQFVFTWPNLRRSRDVSGHPWR